MRSNSPSPAENSGATTQAAKTAAACRCALQLWEFGFDPELDEMLRQA